MVAVDILSGLPTASDGSTCILVVVDYMTKWAEAYALPNEEAHTCMTALYNNFFARFGLPAQIHSDQGRNFQSKLVAELTKMAGIRRTRTTPFYPRSDGQTERMNRTVLNMLRATAFDNPETWPGKLPTIMAAYRMTPHSSTTISPNQAMLWRNVRLPCTLIAAPPEETDMLQVPFNIRLRDNLRAAHQRIRQATKMSAKTQKTYFDARARTVSLRTGQLVWLYWPRPQAKQRLRKLNRLWIGPFRIVFFRSEIVIDIEHVRTGKRQTVHVERIQLCTSIPNIISPPKSGTTRTRNVSVPNSQDVEHQSTGQGPNDTQITTRQSERKHRLPARYRD